jgi:hypothetical protein
MNTKHLLKVGAAWVSIAYVVCFVAVAIYPPLRSQFLQNALHVKVGFEQTITVGNFIIGLIWWNVLAYLGLWLFASLFNKIKQS